MSAAHKVTSPANCFILGLVQPPNALKSLKACTLSQCAYHKGWEPKVLQAEVLPKMVCQLFAEEQIPGVFPLALIELTISVKNQQLLAAVCPLQEQPELGLVQTSTQTVVQQLLFICACMSLTCEVPFLPLQGNMQIYVESPAVLAFWRLALALVSIEPGDRQALTMAYEFPQFLRQVKVAADMGLAMSIPLMHDTSERESDRANRANRYFINIVINFAQKY